ncbi:hypothetical protein BaRGS_00029608, partial [Batillaria attramentaria]
KGLSDLDAMKAGLLDLENRTSVDIRESMANAIAGATEKRIEYGKAKVKSTYKLSDIQKDDIQPILEIIEKSKLKKTLDDNKGGVERKVQQYIDMAMPFSGYSWNIGYTGAALLLVVGVLLMAGVALGYFFGSADAPPQDRSIQSDVGGTLIFVAVFLAFVCGPALMLLTTSMFTTGSVSERYICQGFARLGRLEQYRDAIDVFGPVSLKAIPVKLPQTTVYIRLARAMSSCRKGSTLYRVVGAHEIIRGILDKLAKQKTDLNITKQIEFGFMAAELADVNINNELGHLDGIYDVTTNLSTMGDIEKDVNNITLTGEDMKTALSALRNDIFKSFRWLREDTRRIMTDLEEHVTKCTPIYYVFRAIYLEFLCSGIIDALACKCQEYIALHGDDIYDADGERVDVRLEPGKHFVVRVGGGWMLFEDFLEKHTQEPLVMTTMERATPSAIEEWDRARDLSPPSRQGRGKTEPKPPFDANEGYVIMKYGQRSPILPGSVPEDRPQEAEGRRESGTRRASSPLGSTPESRTQEAQGGRQSPTPRPSTVQGKKADAVCRCQELVDQLNIDIRNADGEKVITQLQEGSHLTVKVGGGWETLEDYVKHSVPLQMVAVPRRNRYSSMSEDDSRGPPSPERKDEEEFEGYLLVKSKRKPTSPR